MCHLEFTGGVWFELTFGEYSESVITSVMSPQALSCPHKLLFQYILLNEMYFFIHSLPHQTVSILRTEAIIHFCVPVTQYMVCC